MAFSIILTRENQVAGARGHQSVGSTLRTLDNESFTIGGLLPPRFLFPVPEIEYRPDALAVREFQAIAWSTGQALGVDSLTVIARRQPGVATERVRAALAVTFRDTGFDVTVEPLDQFMAGGRRRLAMVTFVAALLIALACAANTAALLVAQATYRGADFALRQALGAGRAALLRMLLVEIATLHLIATVVGLTAANFLVHLIVRAAPVGLIGLGLPSINLKVALLTGVVAVVLSLSVAYPTWVAARIAASQGLRSGSHGTDPKRFSLFRSVLTGGQSAVAVLFVLLAVLFLTSYAKLWSRELGLALEPYAVTVSYADNLPRALLPEIVSRTLLSLRRDPSVIDAAAADGVGLLLDGYEGGGGQTIRSSHKALLLRPAEVTANYFTVAGMKFLAGGPFDVSSSGWESVVVNRALAGRLWPHDVPENVVGQSVFGDGSPGRVVGVVADAIDRTLDRRGGLRLYKPLEGLSLGTVAYVLSTKTAPVTSELFRRAILDVEPSAGIEASGSLESRLAKSVQDRALAATLLAVLAFAALGVTVAGVVAMVAFVSGRRTKEFAIRMAIGAERRQIQVLALREAAIATSIGSFVGLGAASLSGKIIESRLFAVTPTDVTSASVAVVTVIFLSLGAAWWPALVASRTSLSMCLRND